MRDEGGWFKIPNAVVDEYLPKIGHTAFAVYGFLCRNVSGEKGYAHPSYTAMQRALGIGRNQVAESLKRLSDHGLIVVEKVAQGAVNHYHIGTPTSLAQKLVSNQNQFRGETETSFQEKPKLVSERDSNKTYLRRPIEEDRGVKRESSTPSPARAHARFSPEHAELSEDELAAQAERIGTDAETLRTAIIPQWADKRLKRPEPPNGWPADLRTFARSWLERAPPAGNGARASPNGAARPVTFQEQVRQNNRQASEDFLKAVEGFGGHTTLRRGDEPPRRRLPDGGNAGDAGGVVDGTFRERRRDVP